MTADESPPTLGPPGATVARPSLTSTPIPESAYGAITSLFRWTSKEANLVQLRRGMASWYRAYVREQAPARTSGRRPIPKRSDLPRLMTPNVRCRHQLTFNAQT